MFLAKAIVSVAANPRKPTFNVTAKGLTLDNDHLSELAWPFFAIWGLLALGSGVAAWRYFNEPGVAELMLVVGLWNTFNMMVAGAGLGAIAERKQPDRHPRLTIDRQGFLHAQGQAVAVQVVNVSAGGMGVKLEGALPQIFKDGDVLLTIEPLGDIVARNEPLPVSFRHGTPVGSQIVYGFKFGQMQPRDYYVHADLMYGDSEALPRFLMSRRKHKNLFAGTGQFLWWGVSEPVRAIAYAMREVTGAQPAGDAALQVSTVWLRRLLAMSKIGRPETPPGAATAPEKTRVA